MIHHVFANKSNVGDWLSARGIQRLLGDPAVREHFCDEPFARGTLARLRSVGERDFVIIGGGGLFMDYFGGFWRGFLEVAERVPFALWGVGCCDWKRGRSLLPLPLMEAIVRKSRLCILRDELTRRILSGCELPEPVPCPSVICISERPCLGKAMLHVDHFDLLGAENYGLAAAAAKAFAHETGRSYRQTNNRIPPGSELALRQVLELYATADIVLTSRLHGCIIGLALGRKVLALSGDRKVESFMESMGLSDWVCELNDLDSLPARLAALPSQSVPAERLAHVRRQQHLISEQMRALLPETALQEVPA